MRLGLKVNYRKEAKGRQCQVRIPGVCNFNPDTTVLAHLPGAGLALKHHDIHGAWCCSKCHDAVDGRVKTDYSRIELDLWLYQGVMRTQAELIKEGKL